MELSFHLGLIGKRRLVVTNLNKKARHNRAFLNIFGQIRTFSYLSGERGINYIDPGGGLSRSEAPG